MPDNEDLYAPYNPLTDPNRYNGLQSLTDSRDTPGPDIATGGSPPSRALQGFTGNQDPDISGNVEPIGFSGRLLAAGLLGGPKGASFVYDQMMAKKAYPVMSRLMQEGNKALLAGDYEKADQVITGMSNLAGQFPQFAPQINAFTSKIMQKRTNSEGNTTLLDTAEQVLDKDKKGQQLVGYLRSRKDTIDPKEMRGMLEKFYPQLFVDATQARVTSPITGKELNKELTPAVLKPGDLPPEVAQIIDMAAGPEGVRDMTDISNRFHNDKPVTKTELGRLQQYNNIVQQGVRQNVDTSRVGVIPGIEYGVNAQGGPSRSNLSGTSNIPTVQAPGMAAPQQQIAPQQQMPQQQLPVQRMPLPMPPQQPPMPQMPLPGTAPANSFQVPNLTPQGVTRMLPGTTVEKATELLQQPGIADRLNHTNQMNLARMDDVARAREMKLQQEEQQAFRTGSAAQQALKQERPIDQAHSLYTMTKDGQLEEYTKGALSEDQRLKLNLYRTADASETLKLRDYNGTYNEGRTLFKDLVKASPQDFSAINKLLATGFNVPIGIPATDIMINVAVPGAGIVTMTRDQASLYNKLVSFGQNSESFTNTSAKENSSVAAMKQGLTGAFTTKDMALATVKSILDIGKARVMGRMLSTPGAVHPDAAKSEFTLPAPTSESGVKEKAQGILGQVADMVKNSPGAKALPDIIDFLKDWNPLTATNREKFEKAEQLRKMTIDEDNKAKDAKIKKMLNDLIDPGHKGKASSNFIDPKYRSKSSSVVSPFEHLTPSWAKKPINDKALKSINERVE